jgi:hypothetical protein
MINIKKKLENRKLEKISSLMAKEVQKDILNFQDKRKVYERAFGKDLNNSPKLMQILKKIKSLFKNFMEEDFNFEDFIPVINKIIIAHQAYSIKPSLMYDSIVKINKIARKFKLPDYFFLKI